MKKYDVIVVGAGPAGSTTAKVAAEAGLDVLMLEKDNYPGENNACGGGIPPNTVLKYKIDPSIVYREVNGIRLYANKRNGKCAAKADIPFMSRAVITRRKDFDKYRAELAVEAGAELKTSARVEKASGTGVYTNKGRFKGEVIVGADGANSVIADSMGLKPFSEKKTALVARYEVKMRPKEIEERFGDRIEIYYEPGIIRTGYGWIFPGDDFINIGIGGIISTLNENVKISLDKFLERRNVDGKKVSYMTGLIPMAGPRKTTVKGNMLLAGDAAGHTGQAFGEGMYYCMELGALAGKACTNYFNGQSLENYHKVWRRRYRRAYAVENMYKTGTVIMGSLGLIGLEVRIIGTKLFREIAGKWVSHDRARREI